MKDPFSVIKERYVTEKATVLQSLATAKSNRSLAKCENPKYLFVVDDHATKQEIAAAVEAIYSQQKVKVTSVNTLWVKPKAKNARRGRPGNKAAFKKAIVTLEPGDSLETV